MTSHPHLSTSASSESYDHQPWRIQNDDYSTEDEEEVLFDLDETAMAELPHHLQNNMREIQLERACRLQKDSSSDHIVMRKPSQDSHADRWLKNMVARMSANLEMDYFARDLREMMHPVSQDVCWCTTQSDYFTVQENGIAAPGCFCKLNRTVGDRNGLYLDHMASWGDNALARCEQSRGLNDHQYLPDSKDHDASGASAQGGKKAPRERKASLIFRKSSRSFISAMRVQVQRSLRRMSMFFKK
ncbi:hypothetical protein EYZ11_011141 [Aspergillus tanneri]|uniref:Uncharacterized protein n=1 Tax=Aspergillus tanneri TaxID=1220188 RepID=A0A4S3J903_9EURO|nr:uncharacterized protein ATNIH1004_007839 [Aspergillus tanneri]KAA8646409.1 hypothetical protein ATNIH1004_007839 [Aspergillus tanneri]THC89411.1 hypothetical protein EYZ11_011141 [Aspergillus tanneri]